ncbi:BspA family leucine-rich repeat surface protein [Listeria innocua]|uniref:BspA family leucine-rich repeat surface protein n=1 Tax=Listeria innocua TaxID=1642 RepID=A0AB73HBK0_LISIO|nr:BspA family leucine-rich repeat surface protein [Listeria innocua]MBC2143438.1 BspA family leucine-rich repeat surface protein [Listeria innocua]
MKNHKKRLSQIVVALLIVYTIGLPIQNVVLASELPTNEIVVTESITAEKNTSNSEDIESKPASITEKESEPTEISSSEATLEESEILTDKPKVKSSEKQGFSGEPRSATQQREGRPSTKAVTTGTFPNGSTATWTFDDATGTLSISGGTLINPNRSIDGLIGIPVTKITNIVLEDKVFASGNCQALFKDSAATSLDLSNLDTSNVTSMRQMFYSNAATSLDLSNFDTSKVTDMYYMFAASAATSLDLSNWDTSNVKNMYSMFYGNLATSLDLSSFDTSNVTDMGNMFIGSLATSLDLSNFDTSKVTNMYGMFQYSAATSLNLSNFDTSNVTNMGNMFDRSAVTSLDLSNFDTSKVTGMSSMFNQSVATSLDLSSFDTSKVAYMTNMFAGASQLQMLTLGSQFKFVGTAAALPNPTPTAKYTGKWQNVGSGTIDKPTGTFGGTATELMSTYDGSTMADLYVWQQPFLNVKDSMLMIGDNWNPEYNFSDAIDSAGDPVDFNAITVTGSVDTTQPGVYTVTYSYGGITSTATVTILETMPTSWVNFFVDGTNVRSIPGSALSTANWDLTTGLWDRWNPGTIKVPTAKLPSEPTKQGYEFKGWEDNTGTIVDFNTLDLDLNSQNEFNFYAAFEKKEYTVMFVIDGKKETKKVLFEELVEEPVAPEKEGHTFDGWYTSPETKATKWDFSTMGMPANDITLHAKFTKLSDSGSGSESGGSEKPSKPVPPMTPEQPENKESTSDSKDKISTSNSGSMTVTSQENISTSSEASQQSKLAQLGEQNSMILQGFGLLMVISGIAFFWWKRKNAHL